MFTRRLTGSVPVFLVACATLAAGQEASQPDTEALTRRAAERLKTLHEEADKLASDERTLLNELQRLEIERQIRAVEVVQLERDVARGASDLNSLDTQIGTLEQQNLAAAPALKERIVGLYKLGSGRYLRLLLSTSDLTHIGQASRTIGAMAAQDRDRIAQHQRRLTSLSASRTGLREQQKKMTTLRTEAQRAKAAADRAVQARNALVKEIDSRRDLNAQLAGELQAAQQRLQGTLANLATGTSVPDASLPIGPFRGDLEWPVSGPIRQRFGASDDRSAATSGIDIAATEGATVHAVHEGLVAFADVFTGFGRLTIIDHGGQAFSLYGNLGEMALKAGARVRRGDAVGTVGVSATGAAGLYFELRIDGRPVDPLQWLRKR